MPPLTRDALIATVRDLEPDAAGPFWSRLDRVLEGGHYTVMRPATRRILRLLASGHSYDEVRAILSIADGTFYEYMREMTTSLGKPREVVPVELLLMAAGVRARPDTPLPAPRKPRRQVTLRGAQAR